MAAWGAWFESIGDAIADGGNPVGMSKTISANGVENNGGANPISGYTLVNAANIDAACNLAKGMPDPRASCVLDAQRFKSLNNALNP